LKTRRTEDKHDEIRENMLNNFPVKLGKRDGQKCQPETTYSI
jgi:hypothetical protein